MHLVHCRREKKAANMPNEAKKSTARKKGKAKGSQSKDSTVDSVVDSVVANFNLHEVRVELFSVIKAAALFTN